MRRTAQEQKEGWGNDETVRWNAYTCLEAKQPHFDLSCLRISTLHLTNLMNPRSRPGRLFIINKPLLTVSWNYCNLHFNPAFFLLIQEAVLVFTFYIPTFFFESVSFYNHVPSAPINKNTYLNCLHIIWCQVDWVHTSVVHKPWVNSSVVVLQENRT